MPKVSNECIDMIKQVDEVDPDDLKQECLIRAKSKRKPSAYNLHMSKCLRQKADDRKELFRNCVDEYNEAKGG